jgi:RNA polymerase sigma-70 factor (ECF subfamily)
LASSWPTEVDKPLALVDKPRVLVDKPLDLAKASDLELAHALMMRVPHAASIAWRRFAPLVSRILVRSLGADEIDDAMQDIFLCVFSKVPGLRRPESLRAFIVSVAIRRVRHEIRRRRRQRRIELIDHIDPAALQSVDTDTDSREALTRFARIIERMNAKDRRVFVLHIIEGLDLPEIAQALDRSVPTIRRRLARSRACAARHAGRDQVLVSYLP